MTLLKYNDLANEPLFSQLQGNILKGHGRDFTHHIFVQFKEDKKQEAMAWISSFGHCVTSCKKQLKERELFKRNGVSGDVFYGFLLTAMGYKFLGLDENRFLDEAFTAGMAGRQEKLKDPGKDLWEPGFNTEIHAMILIADDDKARLGSHAIQRIAEIKEWADITTIEYGNAIRNSNKDGIEHFGYADGVSQPLFFEDELEEYKKSNNGNSDFDPSADKELVLTADPFVTDAFGSYFVFRKLEQDVKGFKAAEEQLATDLKFSNRELAGAMIVGRFEDGTPVTVSDEDGMIGSGAFNNFNYNNDGNGAKCPFHSHIRKTNPRRNDNDMTHRMARRGIPFGFRNLPVEMDPQHEQLPQSGVGLLFMSYQNKLVEKFEFIQQFWVNNANFPNDGTSPHGISGIDPIIGQDANTMAGQSSISTGNFATVYGDGTAGMQQASIRSFVTMKGGEYFFAPSIPFIKSLNGNTITGGCMFNRG